MLQGQECSKQLMVLDYLLQIMELREIIKAFEEQVESSSLQADKFLSFECDQLIREMNNKEGSEQPTAFDESALRALQRYEGDYTEELHTLVCWLALISVATMIIFNWAC